MHPRARVLPRAGSSGLRAILCRMSAPDEPGTGMVSIDSSVNVNIDLGAVGELLATVLGYPAEHAAGILGDLLGTFRFGLSIGLFKLAQRVLKAAGIEPEALPRADLARLLPILEWGPLESDESL